jgi:adenylosuccinate synthase
VAYKLDGKKIKRIPAQLKSFDRCEPVYESLPGWSEDISGAKKMADLPRAARRYVERISKLTGVPLAFVSVGAERGETIVLHNPFTDS